ncbi:MAG: hypothetical protein HOQ11_15315 [Gemmatimonadaceae bacterium]|nr:hypothetical protein [Gemmatimonadaceae bacterium]NUQ92495.1 hypothetical protein [Gemmatimonadaceae bacterium]NUR19965.1 hypothetical protein [Gemmatimonadaceae bacterium]NUS98770.1 hypothetical protein [Gemmatimonadaceae bacterium]
MTDARTEPIEADPLESTLPAAPLSPDTAMELWRWLRAQRTAHSWGLAIGPAEVRAVMRPLCEETRARGGRVEQLIVLLKELWTLLPAESGSGQPADVPAPGWRASEREVLHVVVRLCIDEFYSPVPFVDERPRPRA